MYDTYIILLQLFQFFVQACSMDPQDLPLSFQAEIFCNLLVSTSNVRVRQKSRIIVTLINPTINPPPLTMIGLYKPSSLSNFGGLWLGLPLVRGKSLLHQKKTKKRNRYMATFDGQIMHIIGTTFRPFATRTSWAASWMWWVWSICLPMRSTLRTRWSFLETSREKNLAAKTKTPSLFSSG